MYPYSLTLPGDAEPGVWSPATEEWDGVLRIDHRGRFTDSIPVDDADLFLYGAPGANDLQQFADVVHDNGVQYHGCSPTPDSVQEVEVAGVPALVYAMLCSSQTTRVIRVALVKDGYGLVAAELLPIGGQEQVDRLLGRLEELTWTGP